MDKNRVSNFLDETVAPIYSIFSDFEGFVDKYEGNGWRKTVLDETRDYLRGRFAKADRIFGWHRLLSQEVAEVIAEKISDETEREQVK